MTFVNKMDTYGFWMVNNDHIYIPSAKIKIEHDNIAGSESGRTQDGIMHIDWVRRDVRKIYLQWSVMSQHELDYIINLMQGKEFNFTFLDRGQTVTINAYASNCSYVFYTHEFGREEALYTDVSINVIEI